MSAPNATAFDYSDWLSAQLVARGGVSVNGILFATLVKLMQNGTLTRTEVCAILDHASSKHG